MSERLDRIEALLEGHGMAMADLRARQEVMQIQQERTQQQIDSNAKAIEAQGNQSAADRDLSRQSREDMQRLS